MYLDVYERKANQIFNPNTQSVSSTRINLGLDDDLKIHYKTSPTGSYVSFVKEGSLFISAEDFLLNMDEIVEKGLNRK